MNRPDPGNYAIKLANPKSLEYQVVRTSLLPGMLKTARENRSLPLPMKIFECSDVAVQDSREERQSRNYRRLCALYMDRKAGFEVAHGLLDRVMQILAIPFLQTKDSEGEHGYYIAQADGACRWRVLADPPDPTYLPGRGATVYYRPRPSVRASSPTPQPASSVLDTLASSLKAALPGSRDIVLGSLGILHPTVLSNFELSRPCSALEIDVEPLL
mgnify:CR=1 FL=1